MNAQAQAPAQNSTKHTANMAQKYSFSPSLRIISPQFERWGLTIYNPYSSGGVVTTITV